MNWNNTTITLAQIEPWDENPKFIGKAAAKRLLEYWQKIGQFQSLAVGPKGDNGKHPLYDGHQRLDVLIAHFGIGYEVAVRVSERPLTGDERAEMAVKSHSTAVGQFDFEKLPAWDTKILEEWGLDEDLLGNWNTDAGALRMMLESEEKTPPGNPEPEMNRADELQEKWKVQPGDLYGFVPFAKCPECGKVHNLD